MADSLFRFSSSFVYVFFFRPFNELLRALIKNVASVTIADASLPPPFMPLRPGPKGCHIMWLSSPFLLAALERFAFLGERN